MNIIMINGITYLIYESSNGASKTLNQYLKRKSDVIPTRRIELL